MNTAEYVQAFRKLSRIEHLSSECGRLLKDLARHSREIANIYGELESSAHLLRREDIERLEKTAVLERGVARRQWLVLSLAFIASVAVPLAWAGVACGAFR
jgi:hypothetical protein